MTGPLKEIDGYRYTATGVDYTQKFVETEPFKEKPGEAVDRFQYKLLFGYGSCDIHITDQGRELVNTITVEFYHLTGMHHCKASSYHPQANGLDEWQNRVTEDCIQNYADESQNWLQLLDVILFSIHTVKHSSTKFTPFYMV